MASITTPLELFNGARHLDSATLEEELSRVALFTQARDGTIALRPACVTRGIRFDLSTVEWLDLAATAQIVALADAALRGGATIELIPPLPSLRENEEAWIQRAPAPKLVQQLEGRIGRRRRAASMFARLNVNGAFIEAAARCGAGENYKLLEGFDPTNTESPAFEYVISKDRDDDIREQDSIGSGSHLGIGAVKRSRRIGRMSPLRWLSFDEPEDLKEFAEEIVELLLDPQRGALNSVDVRSLRHAIFHELLENVADHAGSTRHAIVVAWVRPSSQNIPPTAHLPHERGYIEWVRTLRAPLLDLVIADSGNGVHKSLRESFGPRSRQDANIASLPPGDAQVLAWAWDRWSSRRGHDNKRGTRGLYRVDRVARRHHGLAMLRAGTQSVGWDHGGAGYDRLVASAKPLSPFPGTVVRLLLPTAPVEEPAVRLTIAERSDELTVRWIHLGEALSSGLTELQLQGLSSATSSNAVGKPVCVVVQFDPAQPDAELVETVIGLSLHAHPAMVVAFGLSENAATVSRAVDESQHASESLQLNDLVRGPAETDVGSPLLVVLPNGSAAWAGVPAWYAAVLARLTDNPGSPITAAELSGLVTETQRQQLLLDLRDASALAMVSENGNVRARISLSSIVAELQASISAVIKAEISANGGRLVRTPTLRLTRAWVPPNAIWDATAGDHPPMFALAALARERFEAAMLEGSTLVVDSNTHALTAARLKRYLRCIDVVRIPHYAELSLTLGVPLLPVRTSVLTYCDVISSGESVRRALKQVLRDGAEPIAVLCMIDGRSSPSDTIAVLDRLIPVISLVNDVPLLVNKVELSSNVREADAINSLTGRAEREFKTNLADSTVTGTSNVKASSQVDPIIDELINQRGLHFTHVSRPNGRHFTFWIDSVTLMSLQLVRSSLKEAIIAWLAAAERSPDVSLAIWYPVTITTDSAALAQAAQWLKEQFGSRCSLVPVPRAAAYGRWAFPSATDLGSAAQNVVIIDTSAVDGGTIGAMVRLAAECGAERVLACLPLCQMSDEQRAMFEGFRSIQVDAIPTVSPDQVELLLEKAERTPRIADIQVRFLAQFVSGAFLPEACPICAQHRLIHDLRSRNVALAAFRAEALERLRPRDVREIARGTPLGLVGAALSPSELTAIVVWRERLQRALTSTRQRWEMFEDLQLLAAAFVAEHGAARAALLHLLSVESQWLHLPPLQFAAMRELLTEIATHALLRSPVVDVSERLHAIIVLRLAKTHEFIESIESVLRAVCGSSALEDQVVFSVFTFLGRSYHARPKVLENLELALRRLLHDVESRELPLRSSAAAGVLAFLAPLARSRQLEARAHGLSAVTAVWALRRALRNIPPEVRRAFEGMSPQQSGELESLIRSQIRDGASPPPSGLALTWITDLRQRAEIVRAWIQEDLLTNLHALEDLLQDGDCGLSQPLANRLLGILSSTRALDNDEFFQRADLMASSKDIPTNPIWQPYISGYAWWERHVFAGTNERDSLATWVETFPATASAVVENLRKRLKAEERLQEIDREDVSSIIKSFFAPQRFADRCIEEFVWELVRNMPGEGELIQVRFNPAREDGAHVQFRMTVTTDTESSQTSEKVSSGRADALARLSDRLARVNASVNLERGDAEGEWIYLLSFESADSEPAIE